MNATFSSHRPTLPEITWNKSHDLIPLGAVIAIHIGLFFLLKNGLEASLAQQAVRPEPKEVVISLIAPEAKPEPIVQQKVQPHKVVTRPKPVVQKVQHVLKPVRPAPTPVITPPVNTMPSEKAISAPSAPSVSTPEPVAASAEVSEPAPAKVEKAIAPAQPKTITSGAAYIDRVEPEYSAISRRLMEEGKVKIRILINEAGHAESAEIIESSGFKRLDQAARQAALKSRYKPYIENGKAIPIRVTAPYSFSLTEE